MKLEFEEKATSGKLIMIMNDSSFKGPGNLHAHKETINTFVFNKGGAQQVIIDDIVYTLPPRTVLPLVANQHFIFEKPEALIAWQFNREFYCIVDHDAEVGCVGFLFFGIEHPLFVTLNEQDLKSVEVIEGLFLEDIRMEDHMQGELLRTMLKRLIIKITRAARKQTDNYERFPVEKMDLVRQFNLLLEGNYKKEHEVRFYAGAMNKSPKTLSNFFSMCHHPAPSKLIQRRIIQEARRYLLYTTKSAKEISYELGFESPAHFSRFFKLNTGSNIQSFRQKGDKQPSSIHTKT